MFKLCFYHNGKTLFFDGALCEWTIVGQSVECFLSVDGHVMGEVVGKTCSLVPLVASYCAYNLHLWL